MSCTLSVPSLSSLIIVFDSIFNFLSRSCKVFTAKEIINIITKITLQITDIYIILLTNIHMDICNSIYKANLK